MQVENRVYQDEMVAAVRRDYLQGIYQLLIVAATGTGKTVVFSRLIKELRSILPLGKVLVFAHREELVDQAIDSIRDMNPGLKVGKEMANDWADLDCDVIVSCVASIGRSGSTRLRRFGKFSFVICDEAHHSIAQTYLNVFEETEALRPDSKVLLIGFTATPRRRNLKRKEKQQVTTLDEAELISLKSVYKKISYSYPIRRAIKEGWLVPLRGYSVTTETSLDDVKTIAGDFQQDQLSKAVNTAERNKQVVDNWLKYGESRQTVGFTVDIAHAQELAKEFVDRGIKAKAVWGDDPERHTKIEAHKNKEYTVILNAQLLVEGYDDWQVSCILECAPTQSSSVYTQRVGRGTRLQKGTGNLLKAIEAGYALSKRDCIVIDFVDNYRKNSLVTLPTLAGLSPFFDLDGGSLTEAAEEVEALQEKWPGVDFTELHALKDVKTFVQKIDLFAEPYTEEIKNLSEMKWMPQQDGSFMLPIPETMEVQSKGYGAYQHEKWFIRPNAMDEWEVHVKDRNRERMVGYFSTLENAFHEADQALLRSRSNRIKLLKRDAEWTGYAASATAKKYLARLAKNKPVLYCLCEQGGPQGQTCTTCGKQMGVTAGMVATAINKLKAK